MFFPIKNGSTHFGNNRWFTYSPKLQRDIWLYSDLEYDHWVLIETDYLIVTFCEQALMARSVVNGTLVGSIFDMWTLERDEKESLIEVKYSYQLDPNHPKKDLRSILQVQAQKNWCQGKPYRHIIKTEVEIRSNLVYLENMKRLIHFVKKYPLQNEADRNLVLREIATVDKIQVQQILKEVSRIPENCIMSIISKLYINGLIRGNFDKQSLGYNSEVWLNGK